MKGLFAHAAESSQRHAKGGTAATQTHTSDGAHTLALGDGVFAFGDLGIFFLKTLLARPALEVAAAAIGRAAVAGCRKGFLHADEAGRDARTFSNACNLCTIWDRCDCGDFRVGNAMADFTAFTGRVAPLTSLRSWRSPSLPL